MACAGVIPHRVRSSACVRVFRCPSLELQYEGRDRFKGISPMNCGANNRYIHNHLETRPTSNKVSKSTRQKRWELHSLQPCNQHGNQCIPFHSERSDDTVGGEAYGVLESIARNLRYLRETTDKQSTNSQTASLRPTKPKIDPPERESPQAAAP